MAGTGRQTLITFFRSWTPVGQASPGALHILFPRPKIQLCIMQSRAFQDVTSEAVGKRFILAGAQYSSWGALHALVSIPQMDGGAEYVHDGYA